MEHTNDKDAFAAMVAEAKRSGKPFRVEHHFTKGAAVLYLTDAEIAAGVAKKMAEDAEKAARKNAADAANKKLSALGLTAADLRAVL